MGASCISEGAERAVAALLCETMLPTTSPCEHRVTFQFSFQVLRYYPPELLSTFLTTLAVGSGTYGPWDPL